MIMIKFRIDHVWATLDFESQVRAPLRSNQHLLIDKVPNTNFFKDIVHHQRKTRKFLETTITKKWYPVTRLKFYQSLKIKLP